MTDDIITIESKDRENPEVMRGTCPTMGDAIGQYHDLQMDGFYVRVLVNGNSTEYVSGPWEENDDETQRVIKSALNSLRVLEETFSGTLQETSMPGLFKDALEGQFSYHAHNVALTLESLTV